MCRERRGTPKARHASVGAERAKIVELDLSSRGGRGIYVRGAKRVRRVPMLQQTLSNRIVDLAGEGIVQVFQRNEPVVVDVERGEGGLDRILARVLRRVLRHEGRGDELGVMDLPRGKGGALKGGLSWAAAMNSA